MIEEYVQMVCDKDGCDRRYPPRPHHGLHSEVVRLAALKGWASHDWSPDRPAADLCPEHRR